MIRLASGQDPCESVPIYYESRLTKLDINHDETEALSDQVDEAVEDEEDVTGPDSETQTVRGRTRQP